MNTSTLLLATPEYYGSRLSKITWLWDSLKLEAQSASRNRRVNRLENKTQRKVRVFTKAVFRVKAEKGSDTEYTAKEVLVKELFLKLEALSNEYTQALLKGDSKDSLLFSHNLITSLAIPDATVQSIMLRKIESVITKYDASKAGYGNRLLADYRDIYFTLLSDSVLNDFDRERAIDWLLEYPVRDSIIIRLTNYDLKKIIPIHNLSGELLTRLVYNDDVELAEAALKNPGCPKEAKIVSALRGRLV